MFETYTVKENDTIASVAKKFNVTLRDIIEANNLESPYILEVGSEIIIPLAQERPFSEYTVEKGDTLFKIAREYNISVENLAAINGLDPNNYIYPGQKLLVPKPGVEVYITQIGDTIDKVSEITDTSQKDILLFNPRLYLLPEQLIVYKKENERN